MHLVYNKKFVFLFQKLFYFQDFIHFYFSSNFLKHNTLLTTYFIIQECNKNKKLEIVIFNRLKEYKLIKSFDISCFILIRFLKITLCFKIFVCSQRTSFKFLMDIFSLKKETIFYLLRN